MTQFIVRCDTDNPAFANGNMAFETNRVLQSVCDRVKDGWDEEDEYFGNREFRIFDLNGNRIGTFEQLE